MNKININSDYIIGEECFCYLCEFPIPLNIFRGSINGYCNRLALQIDHVMAKCNGGDNSINNLKPTHRYCNASKNKWEWNNDKKLKAQALSGNY